MAETAILPAVFELTGGAGPRANKVFNLLAEIEYPGDPKEDPRIARLRTLWISHQRKVHSMCMVRIRARVMYLKRQRIRQRRAHAMCVPEDRVTSVGCDGMDLPYNLVCAAAVPRDLFDGVQLSIDGGVPDAGSVLV